MVVAVAGVFFVGQFIEGNILQPRLVGKSVGLHPVWLMFALFAFGALFGFVGLLIAVPAAAAVAVLVRFAIARYLESPLYKGARRIEPSIWRPRPRRSHGRKPARSDEPRRHARLSRAMSEPTSPRQLPLDLGHATGYSRDELVVSGRQPARRSR